MPNRKIHTIMYMTRLKRVFRLARALTDRIRKIGIDVRFLKLRDTFDDAKQSFCSLQYSPLLSVEERFDVLTYAMSLDCVVEQINAKVQDIEEDRTATA